MVKKIKDRLTDEDKLSLMDNFIKLTDLKVNKEHLKLLVDKYGAQSYDILQMANLNPQRLMHIAVTGHEAEFTENPIVQDYLANTKSITSAKALEFFATEAVSKEIVDDVQLIKDIQTSAYLASRGVKQSGRTATYPNQEKMKKRMESRRAAQANRTQKEPKTQTSTLTRDGGR